ncbi:MAG: conjugal transfer protein TraH [Duodenibacillus sp.]|nr:conjugal transfer protein TraH [Duodenibacillus sp.]
MKRGLAALGLALTAACARADVGAGIDHLFSAMSNATPPGVYESQRRGVLAGGSYYLHPRIVKENLLTVTPPSVSAGCGGIDLFFGSLSYISADQFVALLRQVAAGIPGYAFMLALDYVAPDVAAWVSAMQRILQSVNQHLGNSCQLAQGVVNTVAKEIPGDERWQGVIKNREDLSAVFSGLADDFAQARRMVSSADSSLVKNGGAASGNIVFKAIAAQRLESWLAFPAGEGAFGAAETLMSMTGTIIIEKPRAEGEAVAMPVTAKPATLRLIDLLQGGQVRVYRCRDREACLAMDTESARIEGLEGKVRAMLLGDGGSIGILAKLRLDAGDLELTAAERGFMAAMPSALGALLRNLAVKASAGVAAAFAEEAVPALTAELASALLEGCQSAILHALSAGGGAAGSLGWDAARRLVQETRAQAASDARAYLANKTRLPELIERYAVIVRLIPDEELGLGGQQLPRRSSGAGDRR